MSKFAKGDNLKKLFFSSGNLLIILYQLTKFEAHSCDSFYIKIYVMTHLKGHNSTKGDNPVFKKIRVSYFLMRISSMKFLTLS